MRKTYKGESASERNYWLWVTRPTYYLDEDGADREDLDPESGVASDGWWTCHKDTQKGDLAFLWRTAPKNLSLNQRSKLASSQAAQPRGRGWGAQLGQAEFRDKL